MNLTNKLNSYWQWGALPRLIKLSLLLNYPWLTALLLAWSIKNLNNQGEYHVLGLGRSIFNDDLAALAHFSKNTKYSVLHLSTLQIVFDHFISLADRQKITESNYHNVDYGQLGRQNYQVYLKKVLPHLIKRVNFQAIISGNIGYLVQQELSLVCHELKISFIVLHKEAIVLPGGYDNFLQVYKHHQVLADKVLFYNKQCMEGFLRLGLPGLTPNKASLVGIPRLDYYFEPKKSEELNQKVKKLVCFSFLPKYSFRFIITDPETQNLVEERGKDFFKALMEFAKNNPVVEVTIKTKMAQQYVDFPTQILKDNFLEPINNLKIVNVGDPSQLIKEADVVLGFNSTTLIEALIADKLIVSPYFGDILPGKNWSFFEKHDSLVHYATTVSDLEKILSAKKNQIDTEVKNSFLDEFISTHQGGASNKAEQAIIATIKLMNNKTS